MSYTYMHCTTCKRLVIVNPTGICLGCQGGFSFIETDHYKPEIKDAAEERKEPEDYIEQYPYRDGRGQAPEASNSHCVKRGRKSKEKKEG